MYARFALILTAAMLAAAALAPAAHAESAALPVELAPGEEVVSHTTSTQKDSQYVVELLSSIKGVQIGADKTTVLVNDGKKTHPIEIEYGNALGSGSANGAQTKGSPAEKAVGIKGSSAGGAGAASSGSGTGGGIGLGQVAGLLLGLTIVSRVIGIVRQLGGGNR